MWIWRSGICCLVHWSNEAWISLPLGAKPEPPSWQSVRQLQCWSETDPRVHVLSAFPSHLHMQPLLAYRPRPSLYTSLIGQLGLWRRQWESPVCLCPPTQTRCLGSSNTGRSVAAQLCSLTEKHEALPTASWTSLWNKGKRTVLLHPEKKVRPRSQ